MKSKNIVTIIIVLIAVIAGLMYHFRDRRTYELKLPEVENIGNITLEQEDNEKNVSEDKDIEHIIEILKGVKRITTNESIQDSPVNTKNKIKIDFYFKEQGVSTIYIYEKKNKYYIEQPYNGIYEISKEDYFAVAEYVVNK